jgi:hypothetical protein
LAEKDGNILIGEILIVKAAKFQAGLLAEENPRMIFGLYFNG